jgi:hypothetical protein
MSYEFVINTLFYAVVYFGIVAICFVFAIRSLYFLLQFRKRQKSVWSIERKYTSQSSSEGGTSIFYHFIIYNDVTKQRERLSIPKSIYNTLEVKDIIGLPVIERKGSYHLALFDNLTRQFAIFTFTVVAMLSLCFSFAIDNTESWYKYMLETQLGQAFLFSLTVSFCVYSFIYFIACLVYNPKYFIVKTFGGCNEDGIRLAHLLNIDTGEEFIYPVGSDVYPCSYVNETIYKHSSFKFKIRGLILFVIGLVVIYGFRDLLYPTFNIMYYHAVDLYFNTIYRLYLSILGLF